MTSCRQGSERGESSQIERGPLRRLILHDKESNMETTLYAACYSAYLSYQAITLPTIPRRHMATTPERRCRAEI